MVGLEPSPHVHRAVDHGVATITLDRPERRNSLTWVMVNGLRFELAACRADDDVRVVVLRGAGNDAFCSGVDLANMAAGSGHLDLHDGRGAVAQVFDDLWRLGKPTVAAVRGYALAGGFGLALACDIVLASDDAVFGAPEIDVGLWPYMITVPLVRSMPPKRALELMLTGRRVGAEEAHRLGFVNDVVPADQLDAAVRALCQQLAAKSPSALRLGRDAFYAVWDADASTALRLLHASLTVATGTDDAREGLDAFSAKRPPEWTGH